MKTGFRAVSAALMIALAVSAAAPCGTDAKAMMRKGIDAEAVELVDRMLDHRDYKKLDTRELLIKLNSDENVVACEPNYIIKPEEMFLDQSVSTEDEKGVGQSEAKSSATQIAPDKYPKETSVTDVGYTPSSVGDLTKEQWYMTSENAKNFKTPNAPSGNARSLNIPGWNGTEDNSSGTIAGAWNGYGISGIAKGVKVFSVRVFGEEIDMGGQNTSPYAITVNAMDQDGKLTVSGYCFGGSGRLYVLGINDTEIDTLFFRSTGGHGAW